MTVFSWKGPSQLQVLNQSGQALKEACATLEFVVLLTALQMKSPASITL